MYKVNANLYSKIGIFIWKRFSSLKYWCGYNRVKKKDNSWGCIREKSVAISVGVPPEESCSQGSYKGKTSDPWWRWLVGIPKPEHLDYSTSAHLLSPTFQLAATELLSPGRSSTQGRRIKKCLGLEENYHLGRAADRITCLYFSYL